jgi:hypothetical protein
MQRSLFTKLNLFKIFITGIPNITIMIEEREIDNNDQKNNILGLKNRQVGEKWVSDDCSYLCKGLK